MCSLFPRSLSYVVQNAFKNHEKSMVKSAHGNLTLPSSNPRNSDRTPASCRVRSKLSSTSRDFNLGPEINSRNSSQKVFKLQLSCHLLRNVLCLCLRQRSKHAPFSLRVLAASWATPQSRKSTKLRVPGLKLFLQSESQMLQLCWLCSFFLLVQFAILPYESQFSLCTKL